MRERLQPISIGPKAAIAAQKVIPLNNPDADYYEKQLIGFILHNQSQMEVVKTHLTLDCFADLFHRKIYEACITIDAISDSTCNVVNIYTVDALISTHSDYAERGGYLYLATLVKECYLAAPRLDAYLQIIKRHSAQRKIVDIAANFHNAKVDTADPLTYTVERINAIAASLQTSNNKKMLWADNDAALMQPTEYLISSWLPEKTFSIFYAPPGCGKSFIALDMAMHIATNQKTWCGKTIRGGDVAYLVGEGYHGFRKRHVAWKRAKGFTGQVRMLVSQCAWGLDVNKDFLEICAEIRAAECKPKLIIVDTLNRFLTGSESDEESVKCALKMIDKLMREFECSVMLVHHTGWADEQRIRGHSSWIGAVDVSLQLQRNADNPDVIELKAKKVKDNEVPDQLNFVLKRYELGDMVNSAGEVESAAIVEQVAAAALNGPLENCKARFIQAMDYWSGEPLTFANLRTFLRDVDGLTDEQIEFEMLAKGRGLVGLLYAAKLIKLDNMHSKFIAEF